MSDPKFTRGPWTANHDGHGAVSIEAADGRQVCFVRNEGDAHLVAASPELFACLQDTFDMIGTTLLDDVFGYEWLEKAKAALAKARGEI